MRFRLLSLAGAFTLASSFALAGFQPTSAPTSPDGVTAVVDLPASQHMRNVGGSDGAGLCVFTSIQHSARWQNVRELDGFREWMQRRPGGGWPEKVDDMIAKFCREKGVAAPAYVQHTGGDETFLELALHTDRLPGVTYAGRDDFYRGRIAHMVSLAHLDATRAAIIDNNRPGSWVWMTRSEFLQRWRDMDGGWAVVFLAPPPPPHPSQPKAFGVGPCVCGDSCGCAEKGKTCPGGCPVAVGAEAVKWHDDYSIAYDAAKRAGKPMLVVVGGENCPHCVRQEKQFADEKLADALGGLVCVKIDGNAQPKLRQAFGVQGYPTTFVVDAKGTIDARFDGYAKAETILPAVRKVSPKRFDQAPPPVEVATENFGIDTKRIHSHPAYSINGQEVTRAAARAAMGGGPLADDSDRWHLTAVGDAALLARFKADVAGLPAATRAKLLVQTYGPADWPVGTYSLPAGVSLRKPSPARESAEVGTIKPEDYRLDLLLALLKLMDGPPQPTPAPNPAPAPAPQPDPQPAPAPAPAPDNTPFWVLALAALAYFLFRKKV